MILCRLPIHFEENNSFFNLLASSMIFKTCTHFWIKSSPSRWKCPTSLLVNIMFLHNAYFFKYLIWLSLIFLLVSSSSGHSHSSSLDLPIISSYSTLNKNVNFTHVTVDSITGRIYLGATNWLYQFNSDLELEVEVKTGPVQDSLYCSPSDCSAVRSNQIRPTKNVNKVLLIDPNSRMLIVCGSVRQGSCQLRALDDISRSGDLVEVPVAANDENLSTVGFVGPARYFNDKPESVFYVAATFTGAGPYRELVPAISARSLERGPRLFNIIEKSFNDNGKVEISSNIRDYYLVNYIYGFSSGEFIYFATVQRKSHLRALEEWGYVTRLARVCSSDAGFHSYSEMTLRCTSDGIDFNILQDAIVIKAGSTLADNLGIARDSDVFFGVFVASKDHTMKLSKSSAVCAFSLKDIENKFIENIHLCYNGSVLNRNMDYIAGSVNECPETGKAGNILDFCNEAVKLNGSLPLSTSPFIIYPSTTLTAITVTTTGHYSIAFLGTSMGALKKILILSSKQAYEFEQVLIDEGSPILQDIHVDYTQKFIIVASPYKLTKVKIERCLDYSNCSECLNANNPYCGWCTLEKKCTPRSACDDGNSWTLSEKVFSYSRWLSIETSQCIAFEEIKPSFVPYNSVSTVELIIHQLPPPPFGTPYLCVFGNNSATTNAKQIHKGLACSTPPIWQRPPIPSGQDHVTVNLAVKSTLTEKDFVQHSFVFYQCSSHKTCTSCTSSRWNCNWCTVTNACVYNTSSCNEKVILGENNPQISLTKGRHHCPSFVIDQEILIPNQIGQEIIIGVKNLITLNDKLECLIEIEEARERVPARLVNGQVVCSKNMYTYQSDIGEMDAKLSVQWNTDTILDTTNVTLYKCRALGSHLGKPDCSLCKATDRKFQCVWCSGECTFRGLCKEPSSTFCPPPRIDSIYPLSGPVEGGTRITIEGSNLGINVDEIKDKIAIGGVPCVPLEYSVSVKVVCKTGPSLLGPHSTNIVIGNRAGVTRAQENFVYKTIEVIDVNPKTGPQSGGTYLYLTGSNFNIGTNVEIYLDDIPCEIKKTMIASKQITCRTLPSPYAPYLVEQLTVNIDGASLTISQPFTYGPDPLILEVSPEKSYLSGGRDVIVKGRHFSFIQYPKLIIFRPDMSNEINQTLCTIINDTMLKCPSPSVKDLLQNVNINEAFDNFHLDQLVFPIGFEMDGVESVQNLKENFPSVNRFINYIPDPTFNYFKNNGIKQYKGESLVIEGANLRSAASESEIKVTIGTYPCNVTSLTMNQLICSPPDGYPSATDEFGQKTELNLPAVVVTMGENIRTQVGYLRYDQETSYDVPPFVIGLISAGGALIMLLSLILLAFFRHKSSQAEREYKRIQLQMDSLENSVRSECKQAFAELQTDLTDLNNDIQATGIPILDYKKYVMKIFFPGLAENPLSNSYKLLNGHFFCNDHKMFQFEELLCSKPFLLLFIETLENQASFTIRDRVNVASLLIIILSDKMDYVFITLRELLLKLIEKYARSKHPQLLLRRSEYVVEKMLVNWMALCMHNYIKEEAGQVLFLLNCAIKHQIEKGPVDAITCESRYSLSEDKLLQEQIDYSIISLVVIRAADNEKFHCKVINVDTISQVKSKILDVIYKNVPYSQRPGIHEIDLEWRESAFHSIILLDEDASTKTINGWRRLNTLNHYEVKDMAIIYLINNKRDSNHHVYETISSPALSQTELFPVSNCDMKTSYQNIYYTLSKKASLMRNNQKNCDNNVRYWHLVKSDDESKRGHIDPQSHKAIPEIYLTRLLSTKGTVQKFVDDVFSSALTINDKLPIAVKWLFDLLDQAALEYGIMDPEIIHAWKSNSLLLRFWVNLVKNPDFVFDVDKCSTFDSCFSVIAQAFMDACSTYEHILGKESPSSKLLFARDMPCYRRQVSKFYYDIAQLPQVTDEEMIDMMKKMSSNYRGQIYSENASKELYVYAIRYREEILDSLYSDPDCQAFYLHRKFEVISYSNQTENVLV